VFHFDKHKTWLKYSSPHSPALFSPKPDATTKRLNNNDTCIRATVLRPRDIIGIQGNLSSIPRFEVTNIIDDMIGEKQASIILQI